MAMYSFGYMNEGSPPQVWLRLWGGNYYVDGVSRIGSRIPVALNSQRRRDWFALSIAGRPVLRLAAKAGRRYLYTFASGPYH